MEPEIKKLLDEARKGMEKSVEHLEKELTGLKAGKLTPALLDNVKISYYGSDVPVNQIANVSLADARTLVIKPYEKQFTSAIEKAIIDANLGMTPASDGNVIRLRAPQLTEERRKEIVKQAKQLAEQARVAIRNVRKDIKNKIKGLKKEGFSEDALKGAENELQKITDSHVKKVDNIFAAKEKEIMTV